MNLKILRTTWQKDGERLGRLRHNVFVSEQKVPEELEWDEHDAHAMHFACEDENHQNIVATARLVIEQKRGVLGRLCVAQEFRREKIATHLMNEILTCCHDLKLQVIELHAQLYLQPFYERFGFIAQGGVYLEAGIEHVTMLRSLSSKL